MKYKFKRIKFRVTSLIAILMVPLLVVSLLPTQTVYADGNAESSFLWSARAAAVEPWATQLEFAWNSTLLWGGDSYYTVTLDGHDHPWQDLSGTTAGALAGAATVAILTIGYHELCVTTHSFTYTEPNAHCAAFAIAGDGDAAYEAAKAEATAAAVAEVQKAFEDCRQAAIDQNYDGDINDFCNRSSASFQGRLENWYRCRYGISKMFDVPYSDPRIEELCGTKPVYNIPTFRSGSGGGVGG
jgi:hypothetical protein